MAESSGRYGFPAFGAERPIFALVYCTVIRVCLSRIAEYPRYRRLIANLDSSSFLEKRADCSGLDTPTRAALPRHVPSFASSGMQKRAFLP